ncbi:MAG TPA: alpha/beta hydrolase [Polyangia bacterium]|nr:alpha/beta hydrolase [Polyangia bacterium]
MSLAEPASSESRSVRANGIEIHYVERGQGQPLLLLDNAMVSTDPVWRGDPSAYVSHLEEFAKYFRVIVPDTRGSGRTVHPGGSISHALLADDAAALIDALGLDRPLICGFSDGGETATIVGLRSPRSARAIVNHGGYDLFNPDPETPAIVMTRQMLGGRPDAVAPDFEAIARAAEHFAPLRSLLDRMKSAHDRAQGAEHWRNVMVRTFERISRPHGYTFEDLKAIAVPALILVGDRDPFCTVEEGAMAYRALAQGELAVLPGTGHLINEAAVETTIAFLRRWA